MERYRISGLVTVRGDFEIELEPVHLAKFILHQENGDDDTMLDQLVTGRNMPNALVEQVEVWDERNQRWLDLMDE